MRFRYWLSSFMLTCGLVSAPVVQANEHVATEGYLLEDLKTHRILDEKESTDYFAPASNLKIFTAFTALSILGPDFQYKTQLFFNSKAVRQQSLQGDVSIVFSGDPMLKQTDLTTLLMSLKAHGIQRINGNVVLVTDAFDDRPYADGWAWDQLHICYSGPVNSVNIDENCMLFHVFSTKNHHPLDVAASVQCSQRASGEPCVINHAMTSDDPNCALTFDHHDNQYMLSGCLPPGTHSQRMKLSIPDTTLYTQTFISQQLKKLGIILQGHVIIGGSRPKGEAVASHNSYPMHSLIRIMLKFSDDLVANALFKTAGAYYYHAQGTWQRGINAEKAIFNQILGLNPKELFIFDGSGESYYNAITPQQMMRVLVYIQKTPALASVIIPALPINGMDGTLVGRLREYPSIIHAKTGTWRDVSSLSGYVMKYNTLWAFTVFVNGMTPVDRGDANQVDAWMRKILPPPVKKTTRHVTKTGRSQ